MAMLSSRTVTLCMRRESWSFSGTGERDSRTAHRLSCFAGALLKPSANAASVLLSNSTAPPSPGVNWLSSSGLSKSRTGPPYLSCVVTVTLSIPPSVRVTLVRTMSAGWATCSKYSHGPWSSGFIVFREAVIACMIPAENWTAVSACLPSWLLARPWSSLMNSWLKAPSLCAKTISMENVTSSMTATQREMVMFGLPARE
mmetsp:Transcript_24107/g.67022  ORF Transcript_24107/g.67022 Transcript_24107/m.67022 type:complete len:200 (+) Transcript_24107:3249-3848(+)